MKNDLMNDITKIQKNYGTSNSLLNQDILILNYFIYYSSL